MVLPYSILNTASILRRSGCLAISVCCLLAFYELSGQNVLLQFNQLDQEKGLSSSQDIEGVYPDQAGRVWISSNAGLNLFDGRHNQVFAADPANPDALFFSRVSTRQFQEDRTGDLWFTNSLAILKYCPGTGKFTRYQLLDEAGNSVDNEYYWSYLDTISNQVYICADRKLYAACPDSIEASSQKLLDTNIGGHSVVGRGDDGMLYLFRIIPNSPKLQLIELRGGGLVNSTVPEFESPDGASINTVIFISPELVYAGTGTGLRRLNTLTGEWSDLAANGQSTIYPGEISSIAICGKGQLAVATSTQGVYLVDRKEFRITGSMLQYDGKGTPRQLPAINTITVDENDVVWIATKNEGVLYASLRKKKFDLAYAGDPKGYGGFKSFAESRNGGFWCNTERGILKISEADTTYYPLPISGEGVEELTFIHEDKSGRVWAGTLEWLFKFDQKREAFVKIDLLPQKTTNFPGYISIIEGEGGDLYFGTNDRSVLILPPGKKKGYWLNAPYRGVVSLFKKGQLLIAGTTAGQLNFGMIDKAGNYRHDSTYLIGTIPTVIRAIPGSTDYYVGTFSGFYKMSFSSLEKLRVEKIQEVPHNGAQAFELGPEGQVWTAGPGGFYQFNPDGNDLKKYTVSDGLQGDSYLYASSIKTSDGNYLFGGLQGFNLFRSTDLHSSLPAANPRISSLLINDVQGAFTEYADVRTADIMEVQELRLPHDKNNLLFRLSSGEFSRPADCHFSYRLLGSNDENLYPVESGGILSFNSLGSGNYLLEIHGSNADGKWALKPHELRLTVLNPIYFTVWAYMIYTLILAGAFYSLYRFRTAEIHQREGLKTAAAQARQQAAETETSVLRLQMNPHFIFNSLNSINSFIMTGRKLEAHEYLMKFADVIRDILNRSTQPLTRLDQAIDLLRDYMEAEQMRMGDKLRFSIEEDPELDTFSYYLPTMIVQPFVENSIKHGIGGLPQGGLITLRFKLNEEEGLLQVEVEDDGRGRRMQGGRTGKHASKALGITNKRMDQLNAVYATAATTSSAPASAAPAELVEVPKKYRYEIRDLKHPDGSPRGTLVVLYLPLTYPRQNESSSSR